MKQRFPFFQPKKISKISRFSSQNRINFSGYSNSRLTTTILSALGILCGLWVYYRNSEYEADAKESNLNQQDWVRIRVWHPCLCVADQHGRRYVITDEKNLGNFSKGQEIIVANEKFSTETKNVLFAYIGHVSVENSLGNYLSFWPSDGIGANDLYNPLSHGKKKSQKATVSTLSADMASEDPFEIGRLPETDVILYSLNVLNVHDEITQLNERGEYALVGGHILNWYKAESCSSAAHSVLKKGNIFELADECRFIDSILNTFNPVKPTEIAKCVKSAKNRELELFPETKTWDSELKENDKKLHSRNLS
jgi:hypothetical protein